MVPPTGQQDLAAAEMPRERNVEGERVQEAATGELLEGHDAGRVVVEEVDGGGAVGRVDGVGFGGREVEAFEVAAGGQEGGEKAREGEGEV